ANSPGAAPPRADPSTACCSAANATTPATRSTTFAPWWSSPASARTWPRSSCRGCGTSSRGTRPAPPGSRTDRSGGGEPMKSVEQHVSDILAVVSRPEPIELDLLRAHGAVLAEPVTAKVPLPPFDNSAVDGYAVRAADVAAATPQTPVTLPVVADIPAGDSFSSAIPAGCCARIMTGAPLPAGADAVVPVEWTDGGVATVTVRRAAESGDAVRVAGGDVKEGAEVLPPGVRIGPAETAV